MNQYSSGDYVFQPGELPFGQAPYHPGFSPRYSLVTVDLIDRIIEDMSTADMVSFDTETTSLYIDELVLVSLSFAYRDRNWVMLINHEKEELCVTDFDAARRLVHAILSRPIPLLWNARFDLAVAEKGLGLCPGHYNVVDVMSLVFLADTNVKMPSLKWAEKFFLGYDAPTYADTFGTSPIQAVEPERLGWYSSFDSYGTLKLGEMFYPELAKRYSLIVQLDRKIIPALMYFEDTQFNVSTEHLLSLQKEVAERANELKGLIYESAGVFLLTSPQQLANKLREYGYDTGVLTKGKADGSGKNMSVSIDALENIKDKVDFVKWIIEYKKVIKLKTSYIDPLLKRADLGLPYRFHYLLNNAPTMRLAAGSFSKPKKKALQQTHYYVDINFQGLSKPKAAERRVDWDPDTVTIDFNDNGRYLVESGSPKMNLRKAVLPVKPSHRSVAIDFAGQELRIAANLSGEPVWIETFLNGGDIHAETAKKIWGPANYDKNKRKMAKIANFGVLYGGGTFFLMQKLKFTEHEAMDFIDSYRAALPTLFAWTDSVHAEARRKGYIITPYGVPRRLSYYYRQGRGSAGFADRSAVNTMIQGSAGVIIRLALTRLYERIVDPAYLPGAQSDFYGDLVFQGSVHDEIDYSLESSRLREFIEKIPPIMTNTVPRSWKVPMEVEVSIGNNWGELMAIDYHDPDLKPIEIAHAEAAPKEAPEDEAFWIVDEEEEDYEMAEA